ncbi:MAG: 50S ribosomal protein L21 [Endomicrobiaceae bacterium]|jgi:large subunit ribosomal protein L21|nr:50S ribosomal protein L21 [Endomicrobiaceae bacterium]MDD3729647.1 50S ribosomal protein L21 [Endomicrobiaceae bacterium]MDD4165881.1 50S ribosomal protein L21 [Endomicrobiaceae bacterium]
MYAIIMTGGKQYRVEKGMNVVVEKLENAEKGQEVVLDQVLMIADGDKATIGRPTVNGANVKAKIVAQKRLPKVLVFKKRPKKGYKKMQGHRQYVTEIEITDIKA